MTALRLRAGLLPVRAFALVASFAALASIAGCGGDSTGVTATTPARVRLTLEKHAATATALEARVTYARTSGERVELARQTITLSTGTSQAVTVSANLQPCTQDAAHAGAPTSCDVFVELTLLKATTALDRREVGPFALQPGQTLSAPSVVAVYEPAKVEITPASGPSLTIEAGDALALTARATDPSGAVIPSPTIAWESASPAVATVDAPTGRVTAVSPGTAVVRALAGASSAEVTVTVLPPAVTTLAIAPTSQQLTAGETLTLTVTARDKRGVVITGRTPTFSSSAPAIATVSASGLVTALAPGAAAIEARLDGKVAAMALTVVVGAPASIQITTRPTSVEEGGTVQLTAVVKDARGNVVTAPVGWISTTPTIASVSSTGVLTGLVPGQARVVASLGGLGPVNDQLVLTVVPATVATVAVQLTAASIQTAQTTQAIAVLLDQRGHALTGRAVTWTSSNQPVATVSTAGVVTGVSPGAATISATSGGVTGSAALTVTASPVDHIVLSNPSATLFVGGTLTLTATPVNAAGTPVAGFTVSYATSNAAVATVTTNGLVTAIAPGTVIITATAGGKNATAGITVSTWVPVPIIAMSVAAPNPATVSRAAAASSALRADVQVPLNTGGAPFVRVTFYWQDVGNVLRPIGDGVATLQQTQTTRTWFYSLSWDPDLTIPLGARTIVAIGVDGNNAATTIGTGTLTVTP